MKHQGVPTTSSVEDTRESVFLVCAVLGTISGAVAAVIGSAEWLGGAYAEALAVVGAALGCSAFATLGALVVAPACVALLYHRHASAVAEVAEPPAASFGDMAMPMTD